MDEVFAVQTHLFFARLMKEHALFLETFFVCGDSAFLEEARYYRCGFEKLLCRAVMIAGEIGIGRSVNSGEFVTPFTSAAEKKTQYLTGITMDSGITRLTLCLKECGSCEYGAMSRQIMLLNQAALRLIERLIDFKERILRGLLDGRIFMTLYASAVAHMQREARQYRAVLLSSGTGVSAQPIREQIVFWNRNMLEHALFAEGMLDPSEFDRIETAQRFVQIYTTLLARAETVEEEEIIRREALAQTAEFRNFAVAGTQGILSCEVPGVILPLMADHALREANHYLRLLASNTVC